MVDKAGVGFGPSILWIAWGLFQIGGASALKSNMSFVVGFEQGGACFERKVVKCLVDRHLTASQVVVAEGRLLDSPWISSQSKLAAW